MIDYIKLRKIVNKCCKDIINEVRYIDTKANKYNGRVTKNDSYDINSQQPIRHNERIRVFHGCGLKTALTWCIEGTSGMEYHGRTYSYESGMNPLGIFVTTDFETAKNFTQGYSTLCIIEFTANTNDLEAPVWNGSGTYFGQGSYPVPFRDKEERNRQKENYRDNARKSGIRHISDSDKPELASSIFQNYEHQALFMGNVNPNMIKRIWVNQAEEGETYANTSKSYVPMSVRDFVKRYGKTEFQTDYNRDKSEHVKRNKYYYPNEDFKGFDDYFDRLDQHYRFGNGINRQELMNNMNQYDHYKKSAAKHMFPKQIIQAFGKDFFDNNFNRLGQ